MTRITDILPGDFEAITRAQFIAENNVKYIMPNGFGYVFSRVTIVDERYMPETFSVHNRSLVK